MSFVVRMTRLHDHDLGEQFFEKKVGGQGKPGAYQWTNVRERAQVFPTEKQALAAIAPEHTKHGNAKAVPA